MKLIKNSKLVLAKLMYTSFALLLINNVNAATITWEGTLSTDWNTAGNWVGNAVPTDIDDVVIPDVSGAIIQDPAIASTDIITCNSLTIITKGVLNVAGTLNINGNMYGSGTYNHTNLSLSYTKLMGTLDATLIMGISTKGTVELAGTNQPIPLLNFYKLKITGSANCTNNSALVYNNFELITGASLSISSPYSLFISGSSCVINGDISGTGKLRLSPNAPATTVNVSGEGSVSSVCELINATLIEGSKVTFKSIAMPWSTSTQTFTNNSTLIMATAPTFATPKSVYAGTGVIIVGSNITYDTEPVTGVKFQITGGTVTSFVSSSSDRYWEYGTITKNKEITGTSIGTGAKRFTPSATALARLSTSNSRVMAGGRIFSRGSSPVPVNYLSFTAKNLQKEVLLSWKTSQEVNNKEFIIESSLDGHNFNSIGKILGSGTSNNVNSYSYTTSVKLL